MLISKKWLSRYVDLDDRSATEILLDLTMSTAEVEGVSRYAAGIDQVVVGHVVARERHPDADKLSVTKVDVGAGELLTIVCGAPNVAAGQRVPVILPGGELPGGLAIQKSKIRGVESSGMICSEKELGLTEESSGILELPADLPVGASLVRALDLGDDVFEIDNKSVNHRPDLWGHYGIARELAAIYGRPLRPAAPLQDLPAVGVTPAITIESTDDCPRYVGLVIEGVRATRSPDWLRWQLAAVGQRSIDLLVDLTNFVMFDLGQPMHAFDLAHVRDGIGVRRARDGETIRTLDDVERRLSAEDLLITSGDRPVALAGVMGGAGSMVTAATDAILLESANFRAARIRRTSTRVGLRSESSARFEKALDPALAMTAVHRYLGLLREVCPTAGAAGPAVDPSRFEYRPRTIRLRKPRLDRKLGITLDDDRVRGILESLEFTVDAVIDGGATAFDVGVPSFRATKDVTIEDDLIEEVGRMYRYDNIPEVPLVTAVEVPPRDEELTLLRRAAVLCATDLGCHEVYDYSFVADEVIRAVGLDGAPHVVVKNPVSPETARIRRHVLPSLLASTAPNCRTRTEVRTFEEGKGYHPERRDQDGLPHEVRELALCIARTAGEHPYAVLREGVETLLARLGHPVRIHARLDRPAPWCHPHKTAAIHRGDAIVGYVGHGHPRVLEALGLPRTTAMATIDVRALLATGRDDLRHRRRSAYPPQPVDIALQVQRSTAVDVLERLLRDCDPELVQRVELFEVYTGEGIPADAKSVNFTVTLGSMDRTLAAKDEEKYLKKVRARAAEVGATLRG